MPTQIRRQATQRAEKRGSPGRRRSCALATVSPPIRHAVLRARTAPCTRRCGAACVPSTAAADPLSRESGRGQSSDMDVVPDTLPMPPSW
jgi:hypothetical protein